MPHARILANSFQERRPMGSGRDDRHVWRGKKQVQQNNIQTRPHRWTAARSQNASPLVGWNSGMDRAMMKTKPILVVITAAFLAALASFSAQAQTNTTTQ